MTSAFHKSALTSSLALGSLASGLHSLLVQMCNVCGLLCVILEELSCFVRVRVFSIPLRSVKRHYFINPSSRTCTQSTPRALKLYNGRLESGFILCFI